MKRVKKFLVGIVILSMSTMVAGCADNTQEKGTRLEVNYEASRDIDKVIYSIDGEEKEIKPMHDDKKVSAGYGTSLLMQDAKLIQFSIKIVDEDKVIYEKANETIQLVEDKQVEVKVVDSKDGAFELMITDGK